MSRFNSESARDFARQIAAMKPASARQEGASDVVLANMLDAASISAEMDEKCIGKCILIEECIFPR